jgi:hypothetical protein
MMPRGLPRGGQAKAGVFTFRLGNFVNRLFGAQTGQTGLKLGGLQGSDSVPTRHPLKPLPDPIPLKIQFPIGKHFGRSGGCDTDRAIVPSAPMRCHHRSAGFAHPMKRWFSIGVFGTPTPDRRFPAAADWIGRSSDTSIPASPSAAS